jgi:hypothetical protein
MPSEALSEQVIGFSYACIYEDKYLWNQCIDHEKAKVIIVSTFN